ncbi:ABC transporter ATP-binding protein [Kyrpidia tusciae]|uniref:ABC transporter related protein n=1 Tax=Kyrpidia tusciae (strain DSM 2912 / NBRC 15312 / T2) TaxID=562970 RepID=D5WUD6_KYRT2|nr:phosphate ABC transporter ATP-binding protein [Kyrpidia tusciae]ADG07388.1 ABC transporter related protein [Kyrpidia tusciae DSM 2912]
MSDSSTSDQQAVRFEQVSKTFVTARGPVRALRGISGEVPAGAILTLVGPSGSGKSTLLSLVNLMVTPDEGRVFVFGREARTWDPPALRRTAALVFQRPPVVPGSVRDNLSLGARLQGRPLDHPEDFLEMVGLPRELLDQDARELSGGQLQRLGLARALVLEPRILLLDEVTSALDPSAVREVETFLTDLCHSRGVTILWVTHDLDQARRVGDWTWLMAAGEIIEAKATEDFFMQPDNPLTLRFLAGGHIQPGETSETFTTKGGSV